MKKPPQYWQITLILSSRLLPFAETIGEGLISLGASGVEQVYKRKRLTGLRTYFPRKREKTKLREEIQKLFQQLPTPKKNEIKLSMRIFCNQDWENKWKAFIKPVFFQNMLAIIPKHIKTLPKKSKSVAVIRMDPGLAFGTGRHPTTYLCVQEIISNLKQSRIRSLLDIGTGSGVLALSASLLDVPRVVAVDTDFTAIQVARDNFRFHKRERKISLRLGSLDEVRGKFDVIVANILLQPILVLLPQMKKHLTKKGRLILSGILTSQVPEIQKGLKKQRLSLVRKRLWRGWACVLARKGR